MIIILTTLIVIFCFIGVVVAFLLTNSKNHRSQRWIDRERDMSGQRFHSHVEQGPDSLYPIKVTKDGAVNQSDEEL